MELSVAASVASAGDGHRTRTQVVAGQTNVWAGQHIRVQSQPGNPFRQLKGPVCLFIPLCAEGLTPRCRWISHSRIHLPTWAIDTRAGIEETAGAVCNHRRARRSRRDILFYLFNGPAGTES